MATIKNITVCYFSENLGTEVLEKVKVNLVLLKMRQRPREVKRLPQNNKACS